jgi:CRP-like cAMP-binding protein
MAVLGSEGIRSESVQALVETRVVRFDAHDVERLLHRHPRTYVMFIDLLIARIVRLDTLVAELADLDGPTRVLRRLCELGNDGTPSPAATIPIAQHHLASLASVSLRLVNGVIAAAVADGVLATARGRIIVLDWQALRRRAGLSAGRHVDHDVDRHPTV